MKTQLVASFGLAAISLCCATAQAAWIPVGEGSLLRESPNLSVIESSEQGVVLEFNFYGLDRGMLPGAGYDDLYDRINAPGCVSSLEVGSPEVPIYSALVGLHVGAAPTVEVLESRFETIEGLRLHPALAPVFEGQEPAFTRNESVYTTNAFYPGTLATVGEPEIMRNLVVARLTLSPVQYNPVTETAQVCTRARIRINEPAVGQALSAAPSFIPPLLDRYYTASVCNYNELEVPNKGFDQSEIKYLVISLPQYYDELAPLVNWRQKMGFPLEIVSVDDIGATSTAIKSYISDLYFSDGLEYVLLVGDIDEVPAHFWSDTYSDSWYSCVDPGGNSDYLADLAIGRITFNSEAELTHQIDKIMSYLKDPSLASNWAEKNTLAAHSEQYPGKYTQCCEEIRTYSYAIQTPIFDTAYGGEGAGNSDVVAAANEGRGIVNYRGHGSATAWTSWCPEGSFTNSNVQQLTNSDMLFVLFSICCNNMELSYGSDCLAESFMKDDNAAIAVLGAWQPSYTDANHTFDKHLFRAVYDEGINSTGYVENWANIAVHSGHGSYGDANIRMYLWLGDPATDIWTDRPTPFSVDYPAAVTLAPQDVEVSVRLQGQPVAGARVCLAKSGEFLSYGFTDHTGLAVLTADPTTPGLIAITVTGHNGLPFEETIEVFTPDGPWIILDQWQLDDSAGGNGDGLADYGEDVVINTAVKNMGLQAAQTVTSLLETDDIEVTITDANESYGNVNPEQVVWGQGELGIAVDENCTDGHAVLFDLTFRDSNDSTWTGRLQVTLHAPDLVAGGVRVDDSAGNGDGQLDPGEDADLYVTVLNLGSGAANDLQGLLSTADPYVTLNSDLSAFPDIPGGGDGESITPYNLSVDATCPKGHVAAFALGLATDMGYQTRDSLYVQIGGFRDDMESGQGDWTHSAVTQGYNDEWHLSTQRNNTPGGSWSWKCGDTGGGDYNDYDDAGLVTPTLYLGVGAKLRFYHWMAAELDSGNYAWDGGIVEISTDQGNSWAQITPEGGYPYLITNNAASPFAPDTPCYSGSVNWEEEVFDLSAYSGEAYVRFRFGTDGNTTEEGWYIDDVRVIAEGFEVTLQILDAPATARPGDLVEWLVEVANNGDAKVIDYWLTGERGALSYDLEIVNDRNLPAGYSGIHIVRVEVPPITPPGTYEVWHRIGERPGLIMATDSSMLEVLP